MKYVKDDIFVKHILAEKEDVHFLTVLYGIIVHADTNNTKVHKEIAKSIELLKTSTLITDDILDKSKYRNGVPSLFAHYGPEKSLCIGEILKSTSSINFIQSISALKQLTRDENLFCIKLFEDTYRTVCSGQLEEFEYLWDFKLNVLEKEKHYWNIIYKTTAAFIQLPLLLGSIIQKLPFHERKFLFNYGKYIGLAYQVRDDLLDCTGDFEGTGKLIGKDIREKKQRLPLLYFLQIGEKQVKKEIISLYKRNEPFSNKEVKYILSIFDINGIFEKVRKKKNDLCEKAVKSISKLSDKEARDFLIESVNLIRTN